MKDVEMSQSAMPATRNEAMLGWTAPKVTPFAELTIGTAIATSCGHLRTVASGCWRLRTVGQRLANTAQPPDPQSKREPLLRIREKGMQTPQKVIQSKYLQYLTAAHWICFTAAAVGVGMKMEIIYIHSDSSILQVSSLL